MRITVKFL